MPVNLLGWHGTVLRVDNSTGAWFHALAWPEDESASDLAIELPAGVLDHPVMQDGFVVEPGREPGRVHIRRDGLYLCADPIRPFVHFEQVLTGPLQTFLAVPAAVMRGVRAVLAGPVRVVETGAIVRPSMADELMLRVDQQDFPLHAAVPAAGDGLVVRLGALRQTLVPAEMPAGSPPMSQGGRTPIPLNRTEPPLAVDAAAFEHGPSALMRVAEGVDYVLPPTTLSDADQIWMQQRPWFADRQYWGAMPSRCEIGRARDAVVVLSRGQEGGIFNDTGFLTNPDYLEAMSPMERGCFSRHGRRVFIDDAVLRDAPVLAGPHVVFYGGLVANYYHWLIEALVPLTILAPHLPSDATLLLPKTLTATGQGARGGHLPAYVAMLDLWGFGGMKRRIEQAPVCRVEEVYWLRDLDLDRIPGECFRQARARALSGMLARPGTMESREGSRIYIRRPGIRRVLNGDAVEEALVALGFSVHELSGMAPAAQMALFRDAHFVVAPHGADLANLLFCAAGTKVIELSPDVQFRGFYGHLSDKLGLSHAMLPCLTQKGSYDADFPVEVGRLTALVTLMLGRR